MWLPAPPAALENSEENPSVLQSAQLSLDMHLHGEKSSFLATTASLWEGELLGHFKRLCLWMFSVCSFYFKYIDIFWYVLLRAFYLSLFWVPSYHF